MFLGFCALHTYRAAANFDLVDDFMAAVPGVCAGVVGLLPPPLSEPLVMSNEFTFTDEGTAVLLLFRKLDPVEAMVPPQPTGNPSQGFPHRK